MNNVLINKSEINNYFIKENIYSSIYIKDINIENNNKNENNKKNIIEEKIFKLLKK